MVVEKLPVPKVAEVIIAICLVKMETFVCICLMKV